MLLKIPNLENEFNKSLVNYNQKIKLFQIATKNRIGFFYLYNLGNNRLPQFNEKYDKELSRYIKTNNTIGHISDTLNSKSINYAFFKTIRPYISTTVDLDILIFGENEDYIRSIKAMKNAGYKKLAQGPKSTTLFDKKANIGIDIYTEIAVSFIVYLDKKQLEPFVFTSKLPNNETVKILSPEADLACIVAHSVIKEQMYTLSEYYSFIYYLKQMNVDYFIQIVKNNNITSAVRTHATITAFLHKLAHNTVPEKLQKILKELGEEEFEVAKLIQNDFKTPHKYHPITLVQALLELTKGKKSRRSIAMQIYLMQNIGFTKKFLKELWQHIKRETY